MVLTPKKLVAASGLPELRPSWGDPDQTPGFAVCR